MKEFNRNEDLTVCQQSIKTDEIFQLTDSAVDKDTLLSIMIADKDRLWVREGMEIYPEVGIGLFLCCKFNDDEDIDEFIIGMEYNGINPPRVEECDCGFELSIFTNGNKIETRSFQFVVDTEFIADAIDYEYVVFKRNYEDSIWYQVEDNLEAKDNYWRMIYMPSSNIWCHYYTYSKALELKAEEERMTIK